MGRIPWRTYVEVDHGHTLFQREIHRVRADETGCPGYQQPYILNMLHLEPAPVLATTGARTRTS
jgi:hypothetical protein